MHKISEIFNFDNIGGKIKNLAKFSCWATILLMWIAAPIVFIVLLMDEWTAYLCWIPLVSAIAGPIPVWIGSWAIYAFGELVEDVHAMRNKEGTTEEEKAKCEEKEKARQEAKRKKASAKSEKHMQQGIIYEGTGYICPSCKITMDYIAPCERCGYIPPQLD